MFIDMLTGKRIVIILISLCLIVSCGQNDSVSRSFEMRWFTSDIDADGETDFLGETEWLNTDQRIMALRDYAGFASDFWENPDLNRPVVTDNDIATALGNIRPQPLTHIRRTIPLNTWKAKGETKTMSAVVRDCFPLDSVNWRFRLHATISGPMKFFFKDENGNDAFSADVSGPEVTIYADIENHRLFVTDNGSVSESEISECTGISALHPIKSAGANIEKLTLFSFLRDCGNAHTPYYSKLVLNIDNTPQPDLDGWTENGYDDSLWDTVELPSCHGGLLEEGEHYHLRRRVETGDFEKAYLDIETITPSGKVWVNGRLAADIASPHPQYLDITDYLVKEQDNIIAVEVNPRTVRYRSIHAPSDSNVGWFLGHTSLILTTGCNVRSAYVHTADIQDRSAAQRHKIIIRNDSEKAFPGNLKINYYPWFPYNGPVSDSLTIPINIPAGGEVPIEAEFTLHNPELWSVQEPRLYLVECLIRDSDGHPVDDFVLTTGIRTIRQKGGTLYINGQPEMLDGAQIMGFSAPVETVSKSAECHSPEKIMHNLLLIKEMGNLLRMHVHSEKYLADGINDSRYAEYADQMGLYLIWQTPAWIREGEVSGIDYEGYPKYMRQVYNHPSIVMWEASNHPNRFKQHHKEESVNYIRRIYPLISQVDSSRLISPTSFWQHMHFGNYDGSEDYQGHPMEPEPLLMAPLMTRGSQDAYTGYGASWTYLRNAPNDWARSCLDAGDKCYFNFEHEESAAQPNWELARMEPWYQVQSYEWEYDEGSIGRKLQPDEWRESQAFQAFSAWESIKKQILLGYDGFSWCSLESGPNMFTYQKPLVDPFGVPKLAYYANAMAFQRIWAGSDNVDTVYGPDDEIRPVIFNLDKARTVNLTIKLCNADGQVMDIRNFKRVDIPQGRSVTYLPPFRFNYEGEGCMFVIYELWR